MNATEGDDKPDLRGGFFESLPCAAWVVERAESHVAHANALGVAMIDGSRTVTLAELDSCFEFADSENASVARLVARVFRAGEEARLQARLRRSPGQRLTLVCWPLGSEDEISAVALMALEEWAASSPRPQDGWWMRVGHDLRGPINPIRMAVQLLKAGRVPAAEQMQAIQLIDRQLDALLEGVQDLSDLLRAEAGALALSARPNDLNLIVDLVSSRSTLLQSFAERRQQLQCIGTDAEIVVDHDPARLASLLEFLLRKASEHAPAGANLFLSLDESTSDACFAISGTSTSLLDDTDLAQVAGSVAHGEPSVKAVLMSRIVAASAARLVLEREPPGLSLFLPKAG